MWRWSAATRRNDDFNVSLSFSFSVHVALQMRRVEWFSNDNRRHSICSLSDLSRCNVPLFLLFVVLDLNIKEKLLWLWVERWLKVVMKKVIIPPNVEETIRIRIPIPIRISMKKNLSWRKLSTWERHDEAKFNVGRRFLPGISLQFFVPSPRLSQMERLSWNRKHLGKRRKMNIDPCNSFVLFRLGTGRKSGVSGTNRGIHGWPQREAESIVLSKQKQRKIQHP